MQLIEAIAATLLVPEKRRLTANVDRLVTMHMETTNTTVPGFLYRGMAYRHSNAPAGKLIFKALPPSLYDQIEDHLVSELQVRHDVQKITQALLALVRPCTSPQDLRDALPDCLVHLLSDDLARLSRTRPEAWTLIEGSRAEIQYRKVLPRIEFFSAARLLY